VLVVVVPLVIQGLFSFFIIIFIIMDVYIAERAGEDEEGLF
jgi:hypothetical protein